MPGLRILILLTILVVEAVLAAKVNFNADELSGYGSILSAGASLLAVIWFSAGLWYQARQLNEQRTQFLAEFRQLQESNRRDSLLTAKRVLDAAEERAIAQHGGISSCSELIAHYLDFAELKPMLESDNPEVVLAAFKSWMKKEGAATALIRGIKSAAEVYLRSIGASDIDYHKKPEEFVFIYGPRFGSSPFLRRSKEQRQCSVNSWFAWSRDVMRRRLPSSQRWRSPALRKLCAWIEFERKPRSTQSGAILCQRSRRTSNLRLRTSAPSLGRAPGNAASFWACAVCFLATKVDLVTKPHCGFCEGATKITKEHVFGKWIGPLFGAGNPANKVRHDLKRQGMKNVGWETPSLDTQVRMACGRCNSGWMSSLEATMQGLITPMILGRDAVGLTMNDQVAIATWSIKTAMVIEFLRPREPQYFTQGERRLLMDMLRPSPRMGAHVWLGFYTGKNDGVQSIAARLTRTPGVAEGYSLMFAVGQFAVQVFAERRSAGHDIYIRPGHWDKTLVEIWPPTARAAWPPPLPLTESDFGSVFQRFMA